MKFDLTEQGIRDLNRFLHSPHSKESVIEVENPSGSHNVAVGALQHSQVMVNGHVGYYCAAMNQHAEITVNGNAGPGLAENMMSGMVHVRGNASQYCGATAHGGLLVVEGNASSRCGISLKGMDIIVGGSIGHMSAFMAQTGRLVVCGDAAESMGDSIYEARIYVRGKVASLGTDCIEKPIEKEHLEELKELLDRAQFNHSATEFKRYGSARRLYNFDVDNARLY